MTTPGIETILPEATQHAARDAMKKDFVSKLKLPRGASRQLVERSVDRVLFANEPIEKVVSILTNNEKAYVQSVVGEFRAWNEALKAPKVETQP